MPTSLSPSRVDAFTSCPLQFRFASIEKLPEGPSIHATKGSLVHRALELLFCEPAAARTPEAGQAMLARAVAEYRADPEFTELGTRRGGRSRVHRRRRRPHRVLLPHRGSDGGYERSASSCGSRRRSARWPCGA